MKHLSKKTKYKLLTAVFYGLLILVLWFILGIESTVSYTRPQTVYAAVEIGEPVYQMPPPEALFFVDVKKDEKVIPHEFVRASISAYTSSADETDSTPNINAMGRTPGPGSIACPSRYSFGTEVIIGGESYFCDDRMSTRYSGGDYFDIWVASKSEAMHWGRRTLEVRVLE